MVRINKDLIEGGNPQLLKRVSKDGTRYSYYLLYNWHWYSQETGAAKRTMETLKDLKSFVQPKNKYERRVNKENDEQAKQRRRIREKEFSATMQGYTWPIKRNCNFLDYFSEYVENYQKKDLRMMTGCLKRWKAFLALYYPALAEYIRPEMLTPKLIKDFVDYLQEHGRGEGPLGYYQRFRKVVKAGMDDGLFMGDPCKGVHCVTDREQLRKDVLSVDEIKQLIGTHSSQQNMEVRRAFIFCLFTGMRWCDVVELKYSNIDYGNKLLKFDQAKTSGHSTASGVVIPLRDDLLQLVGEPPVANHLELPVFLLPTYTMAIKSLRRWVKAAGIQKHITWHCARHSFAVNILNGGANIKTVAALLGHASLAHTEKYTRAVDSLKRNAIDGLLSDFDINI